MTIERLVFSRWGTVLLGLCLVLLCGTGVMVYWTEEHAALEKARQQLSVIARIRGDQLLALRRKVIGDGRLLAADPLLADALEGQADDGRSRVPDELHNRLRTLGEQGGYGDIFLLDAWGTVRFRLTPSGVLPTALHKVVLETPAGIRPILIDVQVDGDAAGAFIGVVAPITRADHHSGRPLGTLVLVMETQRLYRPMTGCGDADKESPFTVLVHRDQEHLLLGAPASRFGGEGQWIRRRLAEERSDSLAARAASGQEGLAQGVDYHGVPSLGIILRVPESDWFVIVSEPVARIFNLWRYRAAVLLVVFGVMTVFPLLLWQYSRNAHYKALYESEFRLRRSLEYQGILLQAIGDGVIATDQAGLIELINPVAEQLTGWTQAEAIGRPLAEVFFILDVQTGEPVSVSAREGDTGGTMIDGSRRHRLCARNGMQVVIAGSTAPFCNDRAEVAGTVVIFHDCTDEYLARQRLETRLLLREYALTHRTDELLHRAMQELAMLVESPKGFWCGLEAPECAVAVEKTSQAEETHPWTWNDAAEEAVYAGVEQWLADRQGGVRVVDVTIRTERRTCRFGTVREIILPVRRSGRLVAVMGVADKPQPYSGWDVETMVEMGEFIRRLVEQKELEGALMASERRYRTLYRSMMDAFVVTDLNGRIRECNEAYGAMLGYTQEELKDRRISAFTPKKWLAQEQEQVRSQLMHGGCSDLYEKEYQHRDGTVFPVELRTFLLVNNEGQPEGMSAVVRDISLRKQAEQEQEQLRQRLSQAQRLESVGQLAGGVAHDFNNMLGVIIGYAELALRGMQEADSRYRYLQEIVKAGKRAADVTRQLLAFARKQTIAPKVLDLNATLEGMLKMLRRLIGEDIELIWMPGTDIWPVKMDPTQIDQLLANLCVNARDAISDVGTVTIETGSISFDEAYCRKRVGFIPGDFVMLAVSDNGSGIDRDILDKIFEPFFTTKAVGQGTGLGLATVYGIVKQNNGFINVYSESGQGTTFRIYLPRQEGEVEAGREETPPVVPLGQGEIVLVVEDELAMLAVNRTMLEQLNYQVLTASTPGEALGIARKYGQAIDLMLIDVIMPEMNGRDLSRAVGEWCPTAKILFMSGYTANVIAHRGELDQGVHFITKPFSTRALACKVRETLLAGREAPEEQSSPEV